MSDSKEAPTPKTPLSDSSTKHDRFNRTPSVISEWSSSGEEVATASPKRNLQHINFALAAAGKYEYECPLCSRGYRLKRQLALHMAQHERDKEYMAQSIATDALRASDRRGLTCLECGREFQSQKHLKLHAAAHERKNLSDRVARSKAGARSRAAARVHAEPAAAAGKPPSPTNPQAPSPNPSDPKKPYECSVCRRGFRLARHLRVHARSHERERLLQVAGAGGEMGAGVLARALSEAKAQREAEEAAKTETIQEEAEKARVALMMQRIARNDADLVEMRRRAAAKTRAEMSAKAMAAVKARIAGAASTSATSTTTAPTAATFSSSRGSASTRQHGHTASKASRQNHSLPALPKLPELPEPLSPSHQRGKPAVSSAPSASAVAAATARYRPAAITSAVAAKAALSATTSAIVASVAAQASAEAVAAGFPIIGNFVPHNRRVVSPRRRVAGKLLTERRAKAIARVELEEKMASAAESRGGGDEVTEEQARATLMDLPFLERKAMRETWITLPTWTARLRAYEGASTSGAQEMEMGMEMVRTELGREVENEANGDNSVLEEDGEVAVVALGGERADLPVTDGGARWEVASVAVGGATAETATVQAVKAGVTITPEEAAVLSAKRIEGERREESRQFAAATVGVTSNELNTNNSAAETAATTATEAAAALSAKRRAKSRRRRRRGRPQREYDADEEEEEKKKKKKKTKTKNAGRKEEEGEQRDEGDERERERGGGKVKAKKGNTQNTGGEKQEGRRQRQRQRQQMTEATEGVAKTHHEETNAARDFYLSSDDENSEVPFHPFPNIRLQQRRRPVVTATPAASARMSSSPAPCRSHTKQNPSMPAIFTSFVADSWELDFLLPTQASRGSVQVTIVHEGGARDIAAPHVLHLGPPCESEGRHKIELPALHMAADTESWLAQRIVTRVASCGRAGGGLKPADLKPRARYRLTLAYRDAKSGANILSEGVRVLSGFGRWRALKQCPIRGGLSRLNKVTGMLEEGAVFTATEVSDGYSGRTGGEEEEARDRGEEREPKCLRVEVKGWIDTRDRSGELVVERVACLQARKILLSG